MSRRLFHMIMAVLGLCSGAACSSDAEEYVQTSEQQPSDFVTPAHSAVIDHGTTDNIAPIAYSERMVERYASAELKRPWPSL